MSCNVVMIGAGNLAVNLSLALLSKGMRIVQVFSRTQESATFLAGQLGTGWTISPEKIVKDGDIYFIALTDNVIPSFLEKTGFTDQLLVHCSGSLPLSVLKRFSTNTAVFYPLQTFTRSKRVNFSEIPILIEANSPENETVLLNLAGKLSGTVLLTDSAKRGIIHLSAAFACNFVNHLYTIAAKLLEDNGMEFGILLPLIKETCLKAEMMHPVAAQTGPAVRNDTNVLESHFSALEKYPVFQEIYKKISDSISSFPRKN